MAKDPPIIEVALSLTFDPLQGLNLLDYADLYRAHFAARFPTFQQAPRLDRMTAHPEPLTTTFEVIDPLALPRLWFVSADTHDLVQVQHDRISFNWRRINPFGSPTEYPGYAAVRANFASSFDGFGAWMRDRHFGDPKLAVAQLVYINAIPMIREDQRVRMSEILAFYRPTSTDLLYGFQVHWWERLEDIDGSIGIHINAAQLPEGVPAMHVQFDARCSVGGMPARDALERVDLMHDKIHAIFDRILTPDVVESAKQ